jgi:hypothetical protein
VASDPVGAADASVTDAGRRTRGRQTPRPKMPARRAAPPGRKGIGPNRSDEGLLSQIRLVQGDLLRTFPERIADNDRDPYKWEYADAPGFSSGLREGSFVDLQYDLKHELLEGCQDRQVTIGYKTLKISEDQAPRSITV